MVFLQFRTLCRIYHTRDLFTISSLKLHLRNCYVSVENQVVELSKLFCYLASMKYYWLNKIPYALILFITLLFANLQVNKRDTGRDICFNICGDARGYYAWLPAIFIYNDLNFSFFDTVELPDTTCGCKVAVPIQDYRYYLNGKAYDKYFPGSSLMMLPFFIIAHVATIYFTHYPANGYSQLYFIIIGLSGVFYYLLGILIFHDILKKLQINIFHRILSIILISFGTNLIYYTIDAPTYSHIYSFTLTAALLYCAFCLTEKITLINIAWLSFLTGAIIITRPVNITILLMLPFVLRKQLKSIQAYFTEKPHRYLSLLPVVIMPIILMILYKISTDHFIFYSYGKENFDFLHPHFFAFLFQYDNGVIPYTPLYIMSLILLFLSRTKQPSAIAFGGVITMTVTIYIHSSWWAYNYGFSFGARTMLDFAPLFGIFMALSLKKSSKKALFALIPVYLLCACFTIMLYQLKSADGYMNHYPITDYWDGIRHIVGIK